MAILLKNNPKNMKEEYLTQEGFTELKNELQELKTSRRREIAEAINTAKEQGDLSENAEYQQAKDEQRRLEQKISEIENIIKHAQIIKKAPTDTVSVGNTVTINCAGAEKVYHIVGSNEANPLEGKISNESPLGSALIAKKQGEVAAIPTPGGEKKCEIVGIA